ncbi:HlyD family efflux transporter periplasmic adaptor subunit [Methylocapsa polymorpha]|uniref:HlyD family efflux transporter periplasmic adaptor subunit n=1 Tax=Methylocapsa polymorpha TaxID=3080828 RepID=A0ABZ0HUA4_9HYPH|nr:HlyD family efflux transporter periplasmic adaptor subunit [Methylocapsa sp. RX1]
MTSIRPTENAAQLSIDPRDESAETSAPTTTALVPRRENLPAIVDEVPVRKKSWRKIGFRLLLLVCLIGGGGAGGFYWWRSRLPPVPAGIVWSNGRTDAEEIDIDTKFAGRLLELYVDEGDMVKAGQVIARMDTRDLEATLKRDEALVRQDEHAVEEAQANVAQLQTQMVLAQQQLDRTSALLKRGYATGELYDQRLQTLNGTQQALNAAKAHVVEATHALNAAQHDVELYKVNIADNTLIAPRAGRLQYRISEPGEVLPAGGKVFTMLDISDVYMDIYLPTLDAGRVKIGNDARIVLDAYPDHPIRAKVTFLATQAQFTPKAVETKSERDKLMFRVKVRIDPDLLVKYAESLRTGLPGNAYVRVDPKVEWPAWLQGRPANDS